MFDGTIGANSVLMPFGGINQMTPSEGMAAHLPVMNAHTTTTSLMTHGFNPKLAIGSFSWRTLCGFGRYYASCGHGWTLSNSTFNITGIF